MLTCDHKLSTRCHILLFSKLEKKKIKPPCTFLVFSKQTSKQNTATPPDADCNCACNIIACQLVGTFLLKYRCS